MLSLSLYPAWLVAVLQHLCCKWVLVYKFAIVFGAPQLGSPVHQKTPWQCGKTPHILQANLVKSWLSPLPQLFPTQPIVPGKVQHGPPKWQVWFLSSQHNWFAFPFRHSSLFAMKLPGLVLRLAHDASIEMFELLDQTLDVRNPNHLYVTKGKYNGSHDRYHLDNSDSSWFLHLTLWPLGRLANPKPPNSPKKTAWCFYSNQ